MFLGAMCAVLLTVCRGQLVVNRPFVTFAGPCATVHCAFDIATFKRDVLDYLDRVVPEHRFVPRDIQVVERSTTLGNKYYEIYHPSYCIRRRRLPTFAFAIDYGDIRVTRLNSAMEEAIDRALNKLPPNANVPHKELLSDPEVDADLLLREDRPKILSE
jgi:hypothetical protein